MHLNVIGAKRIFRNKTLFGQKLFFIYKQALLNLKSNWTWGFRLQRMFQFAFSSLWEENRGFAPSSRREQQSTGLLHLAGFESTLQNAYTSQKHHPFGWCF